MDARERGSAGLAATLFTANGKMHAVVQNLGPCYAILGTETHCSDRSIALLIRHGVRVFGMIERIDALRLRMTFDDALEGFPRARFLGCDGTRTPIIIGELQAA